MIFQDFVSKITAFVKKTPTFSRIQKLLSNCKPSNSGTYILKWFVFSSCQMQNWMLTSFFTVNFTYNFVTANITLQEVTGAP